MKRIFLLVVLVAATFAVKAQDVAVNNDFTKAKFQGYTYLGADFGSYMGGPSLDFSLGARATKHIYLGGGVGWHNLIAGYSWMPYLTFTSDIKGYIPTKLNGFSPRVDLSFGGCVEASSGLGGFYMSCGAGFDYRRFSFGMGYQMPIIANLIFPLGYVRLGIRFGK